MKVKCAKKICTSHAWHFFGRLFGPKKLILWRVKCNVVQTTPVIQMMFHYLEKEGAPEEAVCQAQGLTKPKKRFSASGGGKLLVNFNDSMTI